MRVFKSKWASPKQIAVYVSYDAPLTQTSICFGLAYLRLEHMKYNAYANIRDNKVNIDVVKQTRKRLKIKLYGQKTFSTKLRMYVHIP